MLTCIAIFPVTEAWIGGQGPYRMLIDTGAQSTMVLPEVAHAMGLKPAYRVRVESPQREHWAVGHPAVRLGFAQQDAIAAEVLWHAAPHLRDHDPTLHGILGMNVLRRQNFLLDLRAGTICFDALPAEPGFTLPFSWIEGRIAIQARLGGRPVRLILDSAASHLILFGFSGTGTTGPLEIGNAVWPALTAGLFPASAQRREDGLLPTNLFAWIYVDVARQRLIARARN